MTTAQQITTGSRVRIQLPNWNRPGCVVYTVESIDQDQATLREPRIPGLAGATRTVLASQVVAA